MFVKRLWRDAFLHPDPQHRLGHNARIGALQPVIPPAERLLQESDGRTRHAVVRIKMGPGSDEALARGAEASQEPGNRVAVGIGPTADGIHSTRYGAVVFADSAVLPEIAARGMFEPHLGKKYRVFETVAPHSTPALADQLGIRWVGVVTHQHRAPRQVFVQRTTAHVMHV